MEGRTMCLYRIAHVLLWRAMLSMHKFIVFHTHTQTWNWGLCERKAEAPRGLGLELSSGLSGFPGHARTPQGSSGSHIK